jgi:hypothetical protein
MGSGQSDEEIRFRIQTREFFSDLNRSNPSSHHAKILSVSITSGYLKFTTVEWSHIRL